MHLTFSVFSLPAIMADKFHIFATTLQFLIISLAVAGTATETNAPRVQLATSNLLADADGMLNTSALEYGLQWNSWKVTHRRSYVTLLEELERFVIWRANQAFIDYHNSYADKLGFTLRMNQFGDLTSEEFAHATKCVDYARNAVRRFNMTIFDPSKLNKSVSSLPSEVDWRTMGAVSNVKDSGRCRSCYAFATTGVLEGLHALTTGRLVTLSEQNIIDCSIPYGNRACSGGSVETSLMYVINIGGLDTDEYYPYKERQYLCKFSKKYAAGRCTGMIKIQKGHESDLQMALATFGPVTAVVDSRHNTFQFYSGGVFLEPTCSTSHLTQSVLIIGYGKTSHGKEYWIIKNSWGTTWGMNGYMLLARNLNNHCGIASRALYPSM